ncbi:MAG: YfcE family phosphodiesterase [Anaerolineaceae bacterium]|nr:YfcE family phosphodiesterase [Anaerolineaceae bacterium]
MEKTVEIEQVHFRNVKKIAVLSDTHVPDRCREIQKELFAVLENEKVDLILHAGDICTNRVLIQLNIIAPTVAVRGNRDLVFRNKLPWHCDVQINDKFHIGLTHGHGSWKSYWIDKFKHMFIGYQFERYRNITKLLFPEANVIVFGHTHEAELKMDGNVLFLNPGSTCGKEMEEGKRRRTIAVLDVCQKRIEGRILDL